MNELVIFVKNNIFIISIIICIWFAIDCVRYKRFFTNLFDWSMYAIFSICMSLSLQGYLSC